MVLLEPVLELLRSLILKEGETEIKGQAWVLQPLPCLLLFGKSNFQSCSPFSQGGVSWAGADHQGIYAWSDHYWSSLAGGICTSFLQGFWSNQAEQTEKAAAAGAPVQSLRGAQCLEDITCIQTAMSFVPSWTLLGFIFVGLWFLHRCKCPERKDIQLKLTYKISISRAKAQGGNVCSCQLFLGVHSCLTNVLGLLSVLHRFRSGCWSTTLVIFKRWNLRLRNLGTELNDKRKIMTKK